MPKHTTAHKHTTATAHPPLSTSHLHLAPLPPTTRSYHFARDSLVFVPSERSLPWLPANYVFSAPSAKGTEGGKAGLRGGAVLEEDPLAA